MVFTDATLTSVHWASTASRICFFRRSGVNLEYIFIVRFSLNRRFFRQYRCNQYMVGMGSLHDRRFSNTDNASCTTMTLRADNTSNAFTSVAVRTVKTVDVIPGRNDIFLSRRCNQQRIASFGRQLLAKVNHRLGFCFRDIE